MLVFPLPLVGKMSASKSIHCSSSHPAAFWFWASSPSDKVTMNAANMKTYQSLSDFQTGMVAAVHATLDTEKLIFIPKL